MSKLILIDPETSEPVLDFVLGQGEITIGRNKNNDIVIDSPSVSGHHATVYTERFDSFVHDHASTNGTYVNGKKVRNHALENKDVITIGSRVLLYVFSKSDASDLKATAKLSVLSGQNKGQDVILKSPVTTLGQPGVQFAALCFRQGRYFFSHIDGGDKEEFCLLNGEAVSYEPAAMEFGDTITINQTQLRLEPYTPSPRK